MYERYEGMKGARVQDVIVQELHGREGVESMRRKNGYSRYR